MNDASQHCGRCGGFVETRTVVEGFGERLCLSCGSLHFTDPPRKVAKAIKATKVTKATNVVKALPPWRVVRVAGKSAA